MECFAFRALLARAALSAALVCSWACSSGKAAKGSTGGKASASADDAGAAKARLQALSVRGAQADLQPAFDPARRRYAIRAQDPPEKLEVTAVPDEHETVTVDGTKTDADDHVALSGVEPGSEIEVRVTDRDGETTVYTLVYLPSDFPELRVTKHEPRASTDPIYLALRVAGVYYLAKLDQNGVPLFYRERPRPIFDFKRHPNGELSYAMKRGDGSGAAERVVLDADFEELTRVRTVGLKDTDEHEFKILPNGNYVLLAYERVEHDLTAYGGTETQPVLDEIFQELTPDGDVVFEWNSWDHMRYDESVYTDRNALDYAHLNAVDIDADGNWLLSSRGMAQVLKVKGSTGDVVWRLGGAANDFTFIGDPFDGLCGQHTACWLDNGNILLFDNGQHCYPEMPDRGDLTRVVEYAIDETAMTARLVWSYDRPGAYTVSQGSSQRLDNGNTFIGWGMGTDLLATEVAPDGEIVFELEGSSPEGAVVSYRAFRFSETSHRSSCGGPPNAALGDVGDSIDAGTDASHDSATPKVDQLCADACGKQARAGCKGFDEEACLRDCVSLGLYLVYYFDCFPEFRDARECEASAEYACPGPDLGKACATELSAQEACSQR